MPIPTLPDVCCTTTWLVPTVKPFVVKVEVAEVLREKPPLPAVMAVSLR